MKLEFRTYELSSHNPLEMFPGKLIVALADSEGKYTLHVHFKNGLGLESINRLTLHEASELVFRYAEGLEYPKQAVWIDLPDHVLEQPNIMNFKLKKQLQEIGLYWKRH
jgi:hypothetical protein